MSLAPVKKKWITFKDFKERNIFQNNLDKAFADYSEAIKLDDENANAFYHRGVIQFLNKN